MSTIAPNGQIRFLSDVPLDDTYENTLYFENIGAQTAYFLGLTPVHQMTQCTRVRDGVIRVNELADNLLTCNYLMFQNTNFSNKWFYAFIEDIVYVNNSTTEIRYIIDEIQTWLYDPNGVKLEQCLVEREHTTSDGIFEHLIDEGIKVSERVQSSNSYASKEYNRFIYCLFTASTADVSEDPPVAIREHICIKSGLLNGLAVLTGDLQTSSGDWLELTGEGYAGNDLDRLDQTLDDLTAAEQSDAVVAVITFPKHFNPADEIAHNPVTDSLQYSNFGSGESLDGYVPKNKKLYNYPYCEIEISTSDGQSVVLQPEFLLKNDNGITIYSNCSPSPSLLCVPLWYKGCDYSWENALSLNNFPQAPIALDGYKAWVATGGLFNQQMSLAKNILSDITGVPSSGAQMGSNIGQIVGAGGIASMGALAGVAGGATGIALAGLNVGMDILQTMNNINVAKNLPPIIKGASNGTPLQANKKIGIYARKKCAKKEIIQAIDGYFTMFGYKTNEVKTPSLKNRPHYTYVKTKGCKCNGGAPSSSISAIQTIFNAGVRFWVNASEVGDYSLDNSPI